MTNDAIIPKKRQWSAGPHVDFRGAEAFSYKKTLLTITYKSLSALIAVLTLTVCFIIGCDRVSHADVVIDLDRIAMIESSGCKHKVGDDGDSNGCHQVSSDALKEYNHFKKTKYSKVDLINDQVSHKIADWYLHKRIPQMLKHFKKPVDIKHVLWAYNAGIGRVVEGVMPQKTRIYIAKYKGLKPF